MRDNFLQIIQSRAARIAVGPSTVRGKGNAGVCKAARAYLRALNLSQFGTNNENDFKVALNDATENLRRSLPQNAQKWGLARKILNLFLRDSFYTSYLANAYNLSLAESFFELPLDSIVAKRLKQTAGGGLLDRWPGVIHATEKLSDLFQAAALVEAKKQRVARLHLDALWWSFSRDEESG